MIYVFNNAKDKQKTLNKIIKTFNMSAEDKRLLTTDGDYYSYSSIYNGCLIIKLYERFTESKKYAIKCFFDCSINYGGEARVIIEDLKTFKEICEEYNGKEY